MTLENCNFCAGAGKPANGHTIKNCNVLANTNCPICKKNGHIKKRCPDYDPNFLEKFECGFCRSQKKPYKGHTKRNCKVLEENICNLCSEKGHTGSHCTSINKKKQFFALSSDFLVFDLSKEHFPVLPEVQKIVQPPAEKKTPLRFVDFGFGPQPYREGEDVFRDKKNENEYKINEKVTDPWDD